MRRKKGLSKLSLTKETVTRLDAGTLHDVVPAGGAAYCTQESIQICSEVHTCVSCQETTI
jgi:hypothetical protein